MHEFKRVVKVNEIQWEHSNQLSFSVSGSQAVSTLIQ